MKMNEIETKFYQDIYSIVSRGVKRKLYECSYSCNLRTDEVEKEKQVFYFEIKFNCYTDQKITGYAEIVPQFEIDKYRVDFMVAGNIGEIFSTLVIEIDGHEWHEKTKDQVAKDKKRERKILLSPYTCPIMRFTGSEIYNAKKSIYYDVLDYLALYSVNQRSQQIKEMNENPDSDYYKAREAYYASR